MRMAVTVLVVTGIVAAPTIRAQSPAFEVASVKVNRSGDGSSSYPRLANGRLTSQNTPMRLILETAYGLNALQITGPGWIDSDRFDLQATSPPGVPDTEIKPLLQALLKERFQLAAHMETKEMPVYDLIVTKDGPKFAAFDPAHIPPTPPRNGADGMIIGPMTMAELARHLTSAAGRPVFDKTGLEGRYFCAITYSRLSTQSTDNATGPGALDIFAAVQQQLGLKLEPARAPIEILIVDHAERVPTEN
jgi:uncharacterized protein (TIGR03435 family)